MAQPSLAPVPMAACIFERYLIVVGAIFIRPSAVAHLVERELLQRANTAVLLTMVWGGLAACAFGAVVYDIGRWFALW